jgi:LysR family transcriptional regulator (chromosome initiation inhibitor)
MLDYTALAALAAVLRHGSFDAAAQALSVTPSAISQRIKGLEDRYGCPLIVRGAPCIGTATGKRLARHAEDVGLLEVALSQETQILNNGPRRVRIAVNADSLATWLVAALAQVEGLLFDIEIDDQDHAANWLKRGEVAAAISSHAGTVTGCDTYALGSMRYRAVASPSFIEKYFPQSVTAASLRHAPAMIYDAKDRLQDNWVEAYLHTKIALPHHRLPSTQAFVDGAIAGLGWGLNPEILLKDALASKHVQELLPDTPLDTPLFWQISRTVKSPLAPLTRAIRTAAKAQLIHP